MYYHYKNFLIQKKKQTNRMEKQVQQMTFVSAMLRLAAFAMDPREPYPIFQRGSQSTMHLCFQFSSTLSFLFSII